MSQAEQPARRTVWLATDVPFWNVANGSQQRIRQLARALHAAGFELSLWFLGEINASVREELVASGIWRQVLGPALPPRGMLPRIAWHWDGTWHAMRRMHSRKANRVPTAEQAPLPRRLADFRIDRIAQRWTEDLQSYRPDAVIIEYISLSYLAKAARQATTVHPLLLLDAHDVMSLRTARFRQAGLRNWLEIDAAEEAVALSLFDTIISIQQEEAAEFAKLVPQTRVIQCGYSVPFPEMSKSGQPPPQEAKASAARSDTARPVVMGFLSGAGESAEQGLARFIRECWEEVRRHVPAGIEFHVAGSICDSPRWRNEHREGIKFHGRIDDLANWYSSLDFAINPIDVGTGLKIKSIEALSFGCPLVTTEIGLEGIREAAGEGAYAVARIDEMVAPVCRMACDRSWRQEMAAAANRYIRNCHSPEQVYGELIRVLSSDFASV